MIATGSEVALALDAQAQLEASGTPTRVVSMPSWDRFEQQDDEYKEQVLPGKVKARLAIEAASPLGWERYIGDSGAILGVDRFGASAPYAALAEEYGFTTDHVVKLARQLVG